MNAMQKEENIQAVLIADAYDKILQPLVNEGSIVSYWLFFLYVNSLQIEWCVWRHMMQT